MNRRRIIRRQQELRRRRIRIAAALVMTVIIILAAVFAGIRMTTKTTSAAHEHTPVLYYKSIEVQTGDTLWDLAGREIGPGWADRFEWIAEVERANGLDNDRITAGAFIVVPYYT